jgi:hypothetical protein
MPNLGLYRKMDKKSISRIRENLRGKDERETEYYREEFKKLFERKLLTLGIGLLSELENSFGELWGHGKTKLNLSEDERNFRNRWDEIRNNILDDVHEYIAILQREIERFDLNRRKYTIEIRNKNQ